MNIEQANTINGAVVDIVSTLQTTSPAIVAASAAVAGYQILKDGSESRWAFTKMAVNSIVPYKVSVPRKVRKVVAVTGMTAVALGLTSFAFGAEDAFRTGQSELLVDVAGRAGVDTEDTIVVTQGGADTIMDDSAVPKEVVESVEGVGMIKSLPKVMGVEYSDDGTAHRDGDGPEVDGILLTLPNLKPDTVTVTGLLGSKNGDDISVGGKVLEIDSVLGKDKAPMRREVIITSEDVAGEILDPTNDNAPDDYFAGIIPGGDKNEIQEILDKKYGEGTFEAMTFEEFDEGTAEFMSNNATVILLLLAIATTAVGANYERSGVVDRIDRRKKEIGVLRAMGCDLEKAMKPEMFQTYMRLGAALPLAWLIANGFAEVANNLNPGLNMDIGLLDDFTTALALVATTSAAAGYASGKRLIKNISPSSAMREA